MLAKQYSHRLPADYDMAVIRQRAAQRGPLWDATQGLAFKGFVAQERGRHGAVGNLYASVYLWLDTGEAASFLMGERFQSVIDSFGRPSIETWLPLDARAGRAERAQALYREELPIADGADRQALWSAEIERNSALARDADTVAAVSALDLAAWRLIRLTLSASPIDARRPGSAYEVLHLAHPGLASLR
jgi:hypothetical protein